MTAGETVTELTGTEGGVWQVHTRDSTHIFDLDAWTDTPAPTPGQTRRTLHAGCAPSRGIGSAREATGR